MRLHTHQAARERAARIRELYKAGATIRELSKAVGLTYERIRQIVRGIGKMAS